MIKIGLSALVLISLAVAVPAYAQSEGSDAGTETAAAAVEDVAEEADPMQRIRCRNQRVTGSNARRIRVCMTMAEWSELASTGNRAARDIMRNGASCPSPDAGC